MNDSRRESQRPFLVSVGPSWLISGGLLLACGGPIDIEKATYAGSCNRPVDVTDKVADSCDDDGCRCDKSCFAAGLENHASGCEKDLEVTYSFEGGASKTITCGPTRDETYVFTVSAEGEASCAAGASSCIRSGNACGPAGSAVAACCSGYCDENGVCD
jgi:hypothetical protein